MTCTLLRLDLDSFHTTNECVLNLCICFIVAYLVSILNVLKHVQSCDENHLLMGANCLEDCPFMKKYTQYLSQEMEQMEGKPFTTPDGHKVVFKFLLIPGDMKWVASMSGELCNSAQYFSSFANVNQNNKVVIGGSIGNSAEATWQPWDYNNRLEVVKEVEKFKQKTPNGPKRSDITKFIAQKKSRQESIPPLGKYVNNIKAEPLHITNNAWQQWFMHIFAIAMQYTDKSHLKSATALPDMPHSSTFIVFLECLRETVQCGRLYNAIRRWFSEKRGKGIEFSYRFTGSDSKKLSWHFSSLIQVLLKVQSLSKGSLVKLHALMFVAVKLRDAAAIYSRVEVTVNQVEELKKVCEEYFTAVQLLLSKVSPTVWTLGYVVPYHTKQIFELLGYGLGLNSMQGREAKHIKLANYVKNTCNVRKHLRWGIVFRHEFVSLLWLRRMDPYHKARTVNLSFIPKKVQDADSLTCHCGLSKSSEGNGCSICTSDTMIMIKESIESGRVTDELKSFCESA